jgi:hypothetical protein
MSTANQLKADIEAFCRAHGMSGARFSHLAVGDQAFWFKFSRGRQPTLETYDKIRAFMAEYQA